MVEKVLVLSDTHGALSPLTRILQEVDQNTLIMHSGDFLYHGPRNPLPEGYDPKGLATLLAKFSGRIVGVRGNCDSEIDLELVGLENAASALTLLINDLGIFISHGHMKHEVPFERGIVISGHTHISLLRKDNGIIFMNPGSLSLPKDQTGGSYGTIDFKKGIISLRNGNGFELKTLAL